MQGCEVKNSAANCKLLFLANHVASGLKYTAFAAAGHIDQYIMSF
jgi:hypothetical protein